MNFADQESIFVQQRSGRLWPDRQGLLIAAHLLRGLGGVGVTQAVPELREGLPQLFLIAMETQKIQEAEVRDAYVSGLISNPNQQVIIHPVQPPLTLLQRTSFTRGHCIQSSDWLVSFLWSPGKKPRTPSCIHFWGDKQKEGGGRHADSSLASFITLTIAEKISNETSRCLFCKTFLYKTLSP